MSCGWPLRTTSRRTTPLWLSTWRMWTTILLCLKGPRTGPRSPRRTTGTSRNASFRSNLTPKQNPISLFDSARACFIFILGSRYFIYIRFIFNFVDCLLISYVYIYPIVKKSIQNRWRVNLIFIHTYIHYSYFTHKNISSRSCVYFLIFFFFSKKNLVSFSIISSWLFLIEKKRNFYT